MVQEQNREQVIFEAARNLDSTAQREACLDEMCGEDQQLRARVEELLRVYDEDTAFLESPPEGCVLATPIAEQPGDTIGPYKLLQQIGEGGMGVVYMAEQTAPVERRVALKIIKPGMDTRQVIARFEAERQALAMMDHPNIAKVLDAGTTSTGRPYFVMELVKGVPITDYCDQHQLTPRERLELFVPVCQAVQHAHQKGIIHRDIKPTNVLVARYDGKPVPKIIDFGVAKATQQRLTEKTLFTEFGQVVGTLEYMSPEQAEFNQLDIDTRTDVYSLGVLLYELLAGETPFDRERLRSAAYHEMLRIIREEDPPRPSVKLSSSQSLASIAANRHLEPSKLGSLVRGELDWIVMKAIEKNRTRRYETAKGLAADVGRYLSNDPVSACPPSLGYRFSRHLRRHRVVAATGILVLLGLFGGMFARTWQEALVSRQADQSVRNVVEPSTPGRSRSLNLAQNGQWQTAMRMFERTAKQHPNDYVAHLRNATLQLYLGHVDEYRVTCHDLTRRFTTPAKAEVAERIARVCSLAPNSLEDFTAANLLIDKAQSLEASTSGFNVWFCLAKGLVEYRCGRQQSAIDWLTKCDPRLDRREYGNDIARDAIVYAGLALAHCDLGQIEEAKASLDKSKTLIESRMPSFATHPDSGPSLAIGRREDWLWYDWVHCLILVREAEQSLSTVSGIKDEVTAQKSK